MGPYFDLSPRMVPDQLLLLEPLFRAVGISAGPVRLAGTVPFSLLVLNSPTPSPLALNFLFGGNFSSLRGWQLSLGTLPCTLKDALLKRVFLALPSLPIPLTMSSLHSFRFYKSPPWRH